MEHEKFNIMGVSYAPEHDEKSEEVVRPNREVLLMSDELRERLPNGDLIDQEPKEKHIRALFSYHHSDNDDDNEHIQSALAGILFGISNNKSRKKYELTLKVLIVDAMNFLKLFEKSNIIADEVEFESEEEILHFSNISSYKISSVEIQGYDYNNDLCFIILGLTQES